MKWILILVLTAAGGPALAQPAINSFALVNVADGSSVVLESYSLPVVVIFTSNECPFDVSYVARIKSLIGAYSPRVQFLLINSHIDPAEAPEQMASTYKGWNINVPYLSDKDQVAMEILGARKSPEAFLMKKKDGHYSVVYKGLIDDNPQIANDVKQNYLKESIDKLLAGQSISTPEMRATGCTMRRK